MKKRRVIVKISNCVALIGAVILKMMKGATMVYAGEQGTMGGTYAGSTAEYSSTMIKLLFLNALITVAIIVLRKIDKK